MIDKKKDTRITITKGDTMAWNIKFTNISEDLRSAYFTVKENADGDAVIQKTLGAGITKVDDREYKNEKTYKLQLQAEDTVNLEADMQYLYDIKVAIDNVVKTILSGIFVAKESVTGASAIIIEFAEINAVDLIEAELETTPATNGIEYEQDPVAMASIGDLDNLNTQAKNTIVDALNETNTKASTSLEEVVKIEDGTVSIPEAINAQTAETAETATKANYTIKHTDSDTYDKLELDQYNRLKLNNGTDNIYMTTKKVIWGSSVGSIAPAVAKTEFKDGRVYEFAVQLNGATAPDNLVCFVFRVAITKINDEIYYEVLNTVHNAYMTDEQVTEYFFAPQFNNANVDMYGVAVSIDGTATPPLVSTSMQSYNCIRIYECVDYFVTERP